NRSQNPPKVYPTYSDAFCQWGNFSLMGLADGHLLASQTDGTVLIVKIEKTERGLVSKALDQLNVADFKVLGVVANGVK
ncbi:hypothetical protein QUA03_26480, partial [Microcoleus sp. S36b_A4]